MSDVKVELEEVREESESGIQAAIQVPRRRRRWMYVLPAIALLGIAAAIWLWRSEAAPVSGPSQPIPLTTYLGDQEQPDLSPDGSQVVFAWNGEKRGKYHLYLKPIGSENYLQLTKADASDYNPEWSRNGQWIAFQRVDSTGEHTFLMSPIGGNERKIHDGVCAGISWSSDSKELACGSKKGLIILISADTGDTRQLTFPPNGKFDGLPAFSPDGRRLLFSEGGNLGYVDSDLYLLELNADLSPRGNPRRITSEHVIYYSESGLTWTADGQDAIWAISEPSPFATMLNRVPVLHTGPLEPLPFAGRRVTWPVVRRNRLVYLRSLMDIDIWRADGHTAERHPVSSTEVEFDPQFSPDGKRIAFESERSGPEEIWVANSDGTDPMQLTSFGIYCGSPTWSPDGQWVAFDANIGGRRRSGVWVIESSGGKPRRLTDRPGDSELPSFSRDGKWIYFANDRTGREEIFRVPFGGGPAMQITQSGGRVPEESLDGKMVYYLGDSPNDRLMLREARAGGGQEHPLGITVAAGFQVVSDGIYFLARAGPDASDLEIRFYDFVTRHSRLIQALGQVKTYSGFAVSPDRKTFLYSVEQDNGHNVMLVDNFR